jgi:hypothetical protein
LIQIVRPSEILTLENNSFGGEFKDGKKNMLIESEMHSIWLVKDTEAFGRRGVKTEQDRSSGLSLTYQEWYAIYFDVLGLDKSGYDRWVAENPEMAHNSVIGDFDEEIPTYPMLSRIRGRFHDAAFEPDEIDLLRQECLRVKATARDTVAVGGIDKLLLACDLAEESEMSIYLISNSS